MSVIILVVISFLYLWLTKKQNNLRRNSIVNTKNLAEPNPKIEILASLPAEDPHISYDMFFDPQDTTLAYTINKDRDTASGSSTIVVNGNVGKTYDQIKSLTVSPDGKHVAFIATIGKNKLVVKDGIEGKQYEYIRNLKFSPDSQHLAYCVGEGIYFYVQDAYSGINKAKKMFIVVDSVEGNKYEGSEADIYTQTPYDPSSYDPVFSQDSKEIVYTAIKNGKNIIVADNNELSLFDDQNYAQFIGNSYDLAYVAQKNKLSFLVVGGEEKQSHDLISNALNRPPIYLGKNKSQIAYEAQDEAGSLTIISVVVNDVPITIPTGGLGNFAFSDSGKFFAYYTGTWLSQNLYINGKIYGNIQPEANTIMSVSEPLFSPDEKYLVYSETHQKEENAVIHIISPESMENIIDFPLPGYKVVGTLKFSNDSKYIYFKAWHKRKIEFVTLNIERLINESTKPLK